MSLDGHYIWIGGDLIPLQEHLSDKEPTPMKTVIDLTPEPPKTYDIRLTGAQIEELLEVLDTVPYAHSYAVWSTLDNLVNDGTIT